MAFPQRGYALTLLTLIALAWGITLCIPPAPTPPTTHLAAPRPTPAPQPSNPLFSLSPDAPIAEIIATVNLQTGLLLTREDALAYRSLIKHGVPNVQALQIILFYRQALLESK